MLNKSGLFGRHNETPSPRPLPSPRPSVVTATPPGPAATPPAPAPASTPSAAANETRTPREPAANASRLIVGPEVKLKGAEINDCDTLIVEGRVEATMDSRSINIAERGSFSGTVGIDVAEIHGRFEGELVAREQLIIHATGRVSGKIRYGRILIADGGEVSGDVRSLAEEAEPSREALRRLTQHGEPKVIGTPL